MTTKVVRGQVLVFTATPKDYLGNLVTPSSLTLFLSYRHSDGVVSIDNMDMEQQSDGTFKAEFDTEATMPGVAFASIRAEAPGGAADFKFTIIANAANPLEQTA